MKFHQSYRVLCLANFGFVGAQFSNWKDKQINTSICTWEQPRAALVRDTVYLDGGDIYWSPGFEDGHVGDAVNQGDFQGNILVFNLSDPFARDSNITGLLVQSKMTKAIGGSGISSEPNYFDGAMLSNDAEFFLYGGAVFSNSLMYSPPAADEVLAYRLRPYGPEKPLWLGGLQRSHLPTGMTGYVTYGGAVSAPSENMAWYFSGLASPTKGLIASNAGVNASINAVNVSNTLISVDMTTQNQEIWANDTLPDFVKGRANPEVVWVPVGRQGILVVLGGVVYPQWVDVTQMSEDESASAHQSPTFMQVIDIYDVASKKWYNQTTKGGPGATTRGCAVVAPASDFSSFNIYYYGGFDGIHAADDFSDEVWALSLPSFTWSLINKGTPVHGRAGHKCFTPYPDQLMVFGGYTPQRGTSLACLDHGPVVVFNLTSGEWMDSYSPTTYADYGVHKAIVNNIGGNAAGGATATRPTPSGWSSNELGDVFATKYDRGKLKHYWPYQASVAVPTATFVSSDAPHSDQSLKVLIPAIIVPVVFLIGAAVALWCFCVKRRRDSSESSDGSTAVDSSRNVILWLMGHRASKNLTATDSRITTVAVSPDLMMGGVDTARSLSPEKTATIFHEMEDTQVSELCGTSSPAELQATGFTPLSPLQRRPSYFGSELSYSPSNASHYKGRHTIEISSVASNSTPDVRHGTESPTTEPSGPFSHRTETPSSLGMSGFQDFQQAVLEDAQMDSPVSPCVASERLYGDFVYPASMVSPLQEATLENKGAPNTMHER